jgi:hypothetical protein
MLSEKESRSKSESEVIKVLTSSAYADKHAVFPSETGRLSPFKPYLDLNLCKGGSRKRAYS